MLVTWFDEPHRSTRDVDLLGFGDPASAVLLDAFRKVLAMELDDGLVFDVSGLRIDAIREELKHGGSRLRTLATLAGARVPITVDVGFGDAVEPGIQDIALPVLLDMPSPHLRAYPAEAVIAEKVHAMVALGMANSRMKDYYDVWMLMTNFAHEFERLSQAMRATFARRDTAVPSEMPDGLTDAFAQDPNKQRQWQAFPATSPASRRTSLCWWLNFATSSRSTSPLRRLPGSWRSPRRLSTKLRTNRTFAYNFGQMSTLDPSAVLERQLLLQLGDRLRRLRKAEGLGTVEMAKRVGISRTTLSAIESGDPGPSIGTYLRAMSVLGVSGDLALLAGDTLQPGPVGTAAARSRRARPVVQVQVSADESRHQVQDLQSLALHEEAVKLIRTDDALLAQAQETLERWLAAGNSRSATLWREWQGILRGKQWRKVLGRTRRAQELRQASPLAAVLPEGVRRNILNQISALKKGVVLGDATSGKVA